ncbi:hypothetical protein ALQ96_101778 [Pseudomonas syringae pv. atrofaciens]|nr:hypothetical protein ALQ96_101778 [Pseudomonas syringae pv. atrofaciens]
MRCAGGQWPSGFPPLIRLWKPHEVIAVDYEARTGGWATGSGARILVRVPGGVKRVDGRGQVWCIT